MQSLRKMAIQGHGRYIVVSELKNMGLKNGEIVAMKDAVAQWANGDM
jgi:hypothetical protein